jgi:hypothetical protein
MWTTRVISVTAHDDYGGLEDQPNRLPTGSLADGIVFQQEIIFNE